MALRSLLFAPLNVHQLHREHTDGGELGRKAAGRPAVVSAVNVQHKKSCMIFLRASASGTCHLRLNLRSQSSSVARGVCSSGKGKASPSEHHQYELQYCAGTMPFSSPIMVTDIILRGIPHDCSQRTSPALGAVIRPCRPKASVPIIKSDLNPSPVCQGDVLNGYHCALLRLPSL